MKLLIDGDLLVHRSTIAVEKDVKFNNRYHILWSDSHNAMNVLEDKLESLTDITGIADYLITFSDSDNNFRKSLGVDYKSNRVDTRKPLAYWDTREIVEKNYDTKMLPNIEADDTMGLLMTKYPDAYILWTLDKDLKQIPGQHIKEEDVITITPQQGEDFFYQQVLAGDATDGYFGCPTVGDASAIKIIKEMEKLVPYQHTLRSGARKGETETRWAGEPCADMWEIIVSHYAKQGLPESVALYNAQMARILKDGEYNNGKPILWQPPK